MGLAKEKIIEIKPSTSTDNKSGSLINDLRKHSADDYVFAVVGYAGSGTSLVAKKLKSLLREEGFEGTEILKASSILIPMYDSHPPLSELNKIERITALQDTGDSLRRESGEYSIVAAHLIKVIRTKREKNDNTKGVYIIDSLKHPHEVELLRHVYGENFCLVGVGCLPAIRSNRLRRKLDLDDNSDELSIFMGRDAEDSEEKGGQQVNETFHLADYFVDNSHNTEDEDLFSIPDELKRFVSMYFGGNIHRPRVEERGMYLAHASALRSSCLSRQVGASIFSPSGDLLATGANDVPRPGGGLYCESDTSDNRCFKQNKNCSNTKKQLETIREVYDQLMKSEQLVPGTEYEQFYKVLKKTPVKYSIEYSRSIHAEMDALMSLIRKNTPLPEGSTLYCTTYPCHNCARHIVASGVSKVVYLEPYSKSLAIDLHNDSIADNVRESEINDRVHFSPYQGVSPRLYKMIYMKRGELKDDMGNMIPPNEIDGKKSALWKKTYLEFEEEVVSFVDGLSDVEKEGEDCG